MPTAKNTITIHPSDKLLARIKRDAAKAGRTIAMQTITVLTEATRKAVAK
jgi:hypothetical protein